MPSDPLDPQKDGLYRAQRDVFGDEWKAVEELTLLQLQTFVNTVTRSGWFLQRYGRRSVRVADGRGCADARAGIDGKSIQHPVGTRYRYLALHELAHIVDGSATEDHGAVFAGLYLYFVGKYYGANRKRRLSRAFKRQKPSVVWDRKVAAYGRP